MLWPNVLESFRQTIDDGLKQHGETQADGDPIPVFLGRWSKVPNRDVVYIWRESTIPDHASCHQEQSKIYVEVWTRNQRERVHSTDTANAEVFEAWLRVARRSALIASLNFGEHESARFACVLKSQLDDGGQFYPSVAECLEYLTHHSRNEVL